MTRTAVDRSTAAIEVALLADAVKYKAYNRTEIERWAENIPSVKRCKKSLVGTFFFFLRHQ